MNRIVLDSYAVLAYLEREPGWKDVVGIFSEAASDELRLFLSVVNWGEIYYVVRRSYGEAEADRVLTTIDRLPIEIVPVDRKLAYRAAQLQAGSGLSYADCLAGALADREDAELLTDDLEFRRIEDQVRVRWLMKTS